MPNATGQIYRSGDAPPAAADVANVACTLVPCFVAGREAGETESGTLRFTHVLHVALATDIRDGFDQWFSGNRDTIYILGTPYIVNFVEKVGGQKRAFLNRGAVNWPFPLGQVQMTGTGGAVGGGAASWSHRAVVVGSGGAVGGGTATVSFVHAFSITGSGGALGGGAADWSFTAGGGGCPSAVTTSCTDSATLTVGASACSYSGDGVNHYFKVTGLDTMTTYKVTVTHESGFASCGIALYDTCSGGVLSGGHGSGSASSGSPACISWSGYSTMYFHCTPGTGMGAVGYNIAVATGSC